MIPEAKHRELCLRIEYLLSQKRAVLADADHMTQHGDGWRYDVVGLCNQFDNEIDGLLKQFDEEAYRGE